MIESSLWLLIGCAPFAASMTLSYAYYLSWLRIRRAPNFPLDSPARIPAEANLRRELLRVAADIIFLGAGALSLYQAVAGPLEGGRVAIIGLLLIGRAAEAVNSLSDWRDDRRLNEAVDAWDQRYVTVPKREAP